MEVRPEQPRDGEQPDAEASPQATSQEQSIKRLTIEGRTFHLAEPEQPYGRRAPITLFFRSLAESHGENAIGVILSGMGSNGTAGLKAIKGRGGITMVQQPSAAQYDNMPRSAIDASMVDFVLPVRELAETLVAVRQSRPQVPLLTQTGELTDENQTTLQSIYSLLRSVTSHDFSQYRQPTVFRRIEHRMRIHQIGEMSAYLEFLQNQPEEVEALFRELLIGVTRFFRNPEAFGALQSKVIPRLFEGRRPRKEEVRVWVPGCATGEEAFSMAIVLAEEADQRTDVPEVRILATDPNADALSYARKGVYPASIEADEVVAYRYRNKQEKGQSFVALHQRALADLAPPSVLINENYTILHIGEGVDPFLQFPSGEPTQNLIDVVCGELRVTLRTILYQAFRNWKRVEKDVRFEQEGSARTVKIIARPIEEPDVDEEACRCSSRSLSRARG